MKQRPHLERSTRIGIGVMAMVWLAFAHASTITENTAGGFVAGALHPIVGLDHLVAMVAVGIWGAQLGAPAIWLLPIAFPILTAVGAAIGFFGVSASGAEVGVALSAIALGGAVGLRFRPPLIFALIMVTFFALCHGYTHGTQLPGSSNAAAFSSGFLIATCTLHGIGILFGLLLRWPWGVDLIRLLAAMITATGIWEILPLASA